jgi:tetratricopeptide (TPR) repeat protein
MAHWKMQQVRIWSLAGKGRLGLVAGFALAIAGGLWAPAAHAQENAEATAAADYANQALAHVKKGEFEDARKLYEKAFENTPTTLLLFNLGLAELSAGHGHELDALRHFRQYVSASDAEAPKSAVIKSDLLPRAYRATAHIALEQAPAGASVVLDGAATTAVDGTLDAMPGTHDVVATTAAGKWNAHVTAAAGERVVAHFEREAPPPPTVPPPSPVHATIAPTATPAGVQSDTTEPSRWNTKNVIGVSLLGVALAADLSIIGVMVDQGNADGTLKGLPFDGSVCQSPPASLAAQCSSYNSAKSRFDRDNTLYPVLLGSSFGLVGVAAILIILVPDPKPGKASTVGVRPTFDPVGRTIGVVGSF